MESAATAPKVRKQHGVHYTPDGLSRFLAFRLLDSLDGSEQLSILDPACGDGQLLAAIAWEADRLGYATPRLTGIDRDPEAIEGAREHLESLGLSDFDLRVEDFLETAAVQSQLVLGETTADPDANYDGVISNPPYVRTQVMGSEMAQGLGARFGLKGRVDLYHVFVVAMARSLRAGGSMGLLCSNRFLTTQGGKSMREFLASDFDLKEIWDLGDTRLFEAAVLPAIVIAEKDPQSDAASPCLFTRIYEDENEADNPVEYEILEALQDDISGAIKSPTGTFIIERGILNMGSGSGWSLSSESSDSWLKTVQAHTFHLIEELVKVRVGIKTTADNVYIRPSWESTDGGENPESELIFKLLTHRVAAPWVASVPDESAGREVLYTHISEDGKRKAIDLDRFPRAAKYFETHRDQLEGRSYVIKAKRQWFEMWVPQQPELWSKPKIVWPDISERPRFFLDDTGAIVNGDLYWMPVEHLAPEQRSLILAVANSEFALKFYDTSFGNRLYSGRRRFITQYVKRLPLPRTEEADLSEIHVLVSALRNGDAPLDAEARLNQIVWRLFGLAE